MCTGVDRVEVGVPLILTVQSKGNITLQKSQMFFKKTDV